MPVEPAPFCAAPCILYLNFLGSGSGLVASGDARVNCRARCQASTDYDERMVLSAVPDPGSVFTGWIGECESVSDGKCYLWFDIAKYVYAVFDRAGDPPTPLAEPVTPGPAPPPAAPWTPPAANPRGCTMHGTARSDDLFGTPGRDVICGYGGDDHIHGGGGADVLYGDAGRDEIEAHRGNDRLVGGPGSDRLDGGEGRDDLRARDGARDTVVGGPGNDTARADRRDRIRAVERLL